MELFGVVIPLWVVFIGIILIVIVAWKLIKFAIKVLIAVIIFFVILIGLDFIGVFSWINENILTHLYG
ncbi:MAG: hypothetical protein JSW60_06840 [Thermoplasmatales archaeon]|nr:MAG: hypothetical protein JSW60_06840 [Thermoplasmatales archaeon]